MNPSLTNADVARHSKLARLAGLAMTPADQSSFDHTAARALAAHYVRRLARLFHKRAGEGLCTKPFDRFPQECRARLLAASALEDDEMPILACRFSDQSWTLLTTKRLLWQKHTYRAALPLEMINRVTLHHGKTARRHSELPVTLTHLKIVTTKRQTHVIDLEAGPCCFGFCHLLKLTAKAQHHGQKIGRFGLNLNHRDGSL
jgi:hypothetical protein